jgi:predicted amino acid racemase
MPETIRALAGAAAALGVEHEILLMADMGYNREGLPPQDMAEVLDLALKLPALKVAGLGFSLACLGNKLPGCQDMEKVEALAALFQDKGVKNPVVSAGGSVLYNFMAEHSPGPITELRCGDPFLVGHDIYRDLPLAGGGYRTDVCLISAEVLEIKTISVNPGNGQPCARHAGNTDFLPRASGLNGRRIRALCEMGRFHTSLSAASLNLERLVCEKEGCAIVGLTAGYVVVDVTGSPEPVTVGQCLLFHPGYWAVAQACRNPLVDIEIRDENESRESCAA